MQINTVIVTSSGSILDSNDEADNLIAGALTVNAGSSVTIDTKVSSRSHCINWLN